MVFLSKSTPPFAMSSPMDSTGLFCFYPHKSELRTCYRGHISLRFRTRFQTPKQQFCYKMRRQDSKKLEHLKTNFEGKSPGSCTLNSGFQIGRFAPFSVCFGFILSSKRYSSDFFRTFLAQSWKWRFLVKRYDCPFICVLRFEGKNGYSRTFLRGLSGIGMQKFVTSFLKECSVQSEYRKSQQINTIISEETKKQMYVRYTL